MTMKGKRELFKRLDRKMDKLVELMIVDVFDRLQSKTPVLSGRMASNWTVGIGRADGSFDFDRRKADISAARARAREVAQMARPGDTVFVTNGAPYAVPVDEKNKMLMLSEMEMKRQFPRLVRKVARGGGRA